MPDTKINTHTTLRKKNNKLRTFSGNVEEVFEKMMTLMNMVNNLSKLERF